MTINLVFAERSPRRKTHTDLYEVWGASGAVYKGAPTPAYEQQQRHRFRSQQERRDSCSQTKGLGFQTELQN